MAFGAKFVAGASGHGARALWGAGALVAGLLASSGTQDAFAVGETRSLRMYHSHTNETISITYKSGGSFDSSALEKLNWFLRDWRTDEPISMSPHLFDIVWHVYREVGASEPIKIMSAYRSPGTNAMLRRRSRAVAKESQHMRGNAMDVHIPGVSMARAREIGLRLQRGGVGYYPSAGSPFVHLDVGSVRHWPKMSRDQLARIFPDGKTVHIPADGKPMENYQVALAEVQARGGSALDYATVTSGKSLWALLFGGGDEEEDRAAPVPARGRGRQVATRVADARGAASSSEALGFASNADNPMSARVVQPVEPIRANPRPVAVAALPEARAELPRLTSPAVPEPKTGELVLTDAKSRFQLAANMPVPPVRPRGAAFAQLVASADASALPSALPLPPVRPAGLGVGSTFATASAPAPTPAAPVQVAVSGIPLPPQRPASLPGVMRGVEEKATPQAAAAVAPAQAYASVSAPLPPQRTVALAPARAVQAPRPALEPGRADARAAGQPPLAVPSSVASAQGKGILAQKFTAHKQLPTTGFSGSFVRELDASGAFKRLGQ